MTVAVPGSRLVCLPGTLCTGQVFASLAAALAGGHTRRDVETVDYGAARSAVDAATLVERHCRGAGGPVTLVGFSRGGIVAVQAALRLGSGVEALILIDMNGEADKPENAAVRRAAVARAGATSIRTFVTETTWPTHVAPARQGDVALREAIVAMAEACGLERFANQAEIAITRPRALDRMAELRLPALVICGEEDGVTPVAFSRAISSALPRGSLRLIAGAGHFALMEQPGAVAEAIGPWLDAVLAEDRARA